MKPSAKRLLPEQNGQEVTGLMHISTPDDRVYRYSYNLGILEFRTQRREHAMILAARSSSPVKIQRRAQKNTNLAKLENESKHDIALPTVMEVAPAKDCSLTEIEMRVNKQERTYKAQQVLSAEEIVNVCQVKTSESNSLEANGAPKGPLPPSEGCVTKNNEEETAFNAQFLPPIEKFRRAARVLGVCLPPKELYCLQRRNGACDETEWFLEHKTLLRILNKRF